ncbi:MAG: diacylglycerol kinase [Pseudomonadales bacterium]|nr:diacylglycerol kinase [Pseudomonadales bacterium]
MADTKDPETLSPPPPKKGLSRLIAATGYSAAGIKAAFKNEEAVRMEIGAFIVMAPLGLWLGETPVEKVLLVACLVFVIVVELLNTGIETVVDRVGKDYHELSRVAKDIGSAAVFISLALVIFTWAMLLL